MRALNQYISTPKFVGNDGTLMNKIFETIFKGCEIKLLLVDCYVCLYVLDQIYLVVVHFLT